MCGPRIWHVQDGKSMQGQHKRPEGKSSRHPQGEQTQRGQQHRITSAPSEHSRFPSRPSSSAPPRASPLPPSFLSRLPPLGFSGGGQRTWLRHSRRQPRTGDQTKFLCCLPRLPWHHLFSENPLTWGTYFQGQNANQKRDLLLTAHPPSVITLPPSV